MKLIAKTVCLLLVIIAAAEASTSPCDQLKLAASYDVIVVGTGLGGSVAARRLAEWNPNWNILVIERGLSFASAPLCATSYNQPGCDNDPNSGPYIFTTPQPGVNNQTVAIKDAAIQGGATAVNGFFHVRGDAERLFANYFPPNWNFLSMIPFYERYENYTFPPGFHKGYPWTYPTELRGNAGPVIATQQDANTRQNISTRFLNAVQNKYPNMPVYYDRSVNDGFFPGIGASYIETTSKGPSRVTAYTSYIQTYKGSNLKAIYGTLATKVVFDSSAQVTGVQLVLTSAMAAQLGLGNQTLAKCVVSTSKVVVSSGALGTPKLLQLSGVGPAPLLTQYGIPVVSNVPGVGQNFRDHFTIFSFLAPKNATTNPVVYNNNTTNNFGWAFYNANDTQGVPNDFIYGFQSFSPSNYIFTSAGSNLKSRGTVNIASTDPTVPPAVNPNYFQNPQDRYGIGLAALKSFNISNALGLAQVIDPCAANPCNTPQQTLQAFINTGLLAPGYHFSATAALCNVTNPVSLRVKGTRGLYVLDASIMPYSPPSNTQATIYAVSERGIDQINANMHSSYDLQDIEEVAGWVICQFAPNVAAIQ